MEKQRLKKRKFEKKKIVVQYKEGVEGSLVKALHIVSKLH
jgi:hypothetical protein